MIDKLPDTLEEFEAMHNHVHSYIVTEYAWLDGGKDYKPPKPTILRAKTLTCSTCLETKEL
jgi:hypothetical protein